MSFKELALLILFVGTIYSGINTISKILDGFGGASDVCLSVPIGLVDDTSR